MNDDSNTTSFIPEAEIGSIDLPSMIGVHLQSISSQKKEASKLKDMLESIFLNDATYQDHISKVKEANKLKNQTKKQILKLPSSQDLSSRLADVKSRTKELQKDLSELLAQYAATGATSIETPDGEVKQIVTTAKLV